MEYKLILKSSKSSNSRWVYATDAPALTMCIIPTSAGLVIYLFCEKPCEGVFMAELINKKQLRNFMTFMSGPVGDPNYVHCAGFRIIYKNKVEMEEDGLPKLNIKQNFDAVEYRCDDFIESHDGYQNMQDLLKHFQKFNISQVLLGSGLIDCLS